MPTPDALIENAAPLASPGAFCPRQDAIRIVSHLVALNGLLSARRCRPLQR